LPETTMRGVIVPPGAMSRSRSLSKVELWHDASRTGNAAFEVKGHREYWPIRSCEFRMQLDNEVQRVG
jgi:hypothetical protein